MSIFRVLVFFANDNYAERLVRAKSEHDAVNEALNKYPEAVTATVAQ